MPRIVNFDSKQIIEPGVNSRILGLVPAPVVTGTYGNVMLIDTGSGSGYGGGAGVNGELSQGGDAVYEFASAIDFKRFIRGGRLYDVADYLFAPSNNGTGPNRLYYARAAATVAAKTTIAFEDAAEAAAGQVVIAANNEGVGANGTLTGGVITKGYGYKIKAGIIDTSAFIIEFYEGQYHGTDENGIPYDGIYESAIVAGTVVATSPEFKTANVLIAWMQSDYNFRNYFTLNSSTASTLVIDAALLTTYSGVQAFAGGTTAYSSTALDDLLETIVDLDNSMFLCDDYGKTTAPTGQQILDGTNKGALSVFNQKILAHCVSQATFTRKAIYIGGGQDNTEYNITATSDGSENVAIYYNSSLTHVIHSAIKVPATVVGTGQTFKFLDSFFHAALICGRVAGLQPQVPLTYKDIRIIGVKHLLKLSERNRALLHGVIHPKFVTGKGWVVNQGINTMQNNASVILNDGTSPEISIMRIIHQINKEIVLSLGASNFIGGNLRSVSSAELKAAIEGYLFSRCANDIDDNLIISFQKVEAKLEQDVWKVTYCFIPNGPINRIFVTGFMLDPSVAL